jgi:hypothetical protein
LPFEFEWSLDRIHSTLNEVRQFAGSLDRDFRGPITAVFFAPNRDRVHVDSSVAKRAENLRQPFEQQFAVVAPSVLIRVADEFADGIPVMFLDLLEEMSIVELDLALRLPQPEKINPPDQRDHEAGIESVAKSHA